MEKVYDEILQLLKKVNSLHKLKVIRSFIKGLLE